MKTNSIVIGSLVLLGVAMLEGECAGQGAITRLFQKGVSPDSTYTQCLDSTLRSLTGGTFGMQSLGRAPTLNPRWQDIDGSGLVWFDLSSIPSVASVSSATLRIWFEPSEFETSSGYLAAVRLLDPDGTGLWGENTNAIEADYGVAASTNAWGCASYKRPDVAWTVAGGRVTGVTGSMARVWHVAGASEWIEWDVTPSVQDFVQAPATNLGWLLQAEVDETLRGDLFTCDAPIASNRPQLEVIYGVPSALPPTADAGADQWLTDSDTNGWEGVTLDGSASSDGNGFIVSYSWSTGGVQVATGALAQISLPLGTHPVLLTVTDDESLTGTDTVQVVVQSVPTNAAPILASIGNQTGRTGQELRFTVSATDSDGDSLFYSASNLPSGASFVSRQFVWTPASGQTGLFTGVGFYVEDGHAGTDSELIDITVQGAFTGGTTWVVRVDGGTPAQCTGLVDAPYPGSGTNQPCAWDHPFRALPPGGSPRIAGGDTLRIGSGSYRMGYGAPGADVCDSSAPWDCYMPPIPSGPDAAHPTRILGAVSASGNTNKPVLWGTERAWLLLNLTGATNVEIGNLELTDHSGCVEFHSGGIPCQRTAFPYGDWSPRGIYAEDAKNIDLHDLDIHGLAYAGIHAGRLTDWTVERVRVAGNGWVGWDGDIDGDDGNSGTLAFDRLVVEWNGCGETYPGGNPTGCWAQSAGGYGDGLGTGETGGTWIFENSEFLYNTSDGLDLLYVRRPGSSITIRNTRAEGNAGNQLKTSGPALIENCIAVGNCGFFEGQPFTYSVDPCRALGNTLSLELGQGDQTSILNSTVAGEGDCLVLAVSRDAVSDGTEQVLLRNNIFLGFPDFHQSYENTCLTWGEGFLSDPFDLDYSVIQQVKGNPCPVGTNDICQNPQLSDMTLDAFDPIPLSNSPAIDAGVDLPAVGRDVSGTSRPLDGLNDGTHRWDIGAYEFVHPLADSDADTMRDADEVLAGTDATNPASLFALGPIQSGPGPILNWWGVAERSYDIEFASVSTGAWTALSGGTNRMGTNGWIGITNPVPPSHRYYRLRVRKP